MCVCDCKDFLMIIVLISIKINDCKAGYRVLTYPHNDLDYVVGIISHSLIYLVFIHTLQMCSFVIDRRETWE